MNRLEELIPIYGEHNNQLSEIKKICDSEKEELKSLMLEQDVDNKTAGGYRVSRSESERESLDEEKMLNILKRDWVSRNGSMECPYIRTREYVDMDALERALYAGNIDDSVIAELDSCRTVTKVVSLRCTKEKTKKVREVNE